MKRAIALLMALVLMLVSLGSVAAQSGPSQDPVDPVDGCEYFEDTGHNVCGIFAEYWEANGGLPVFGFPITEAVEQVSLDTGNTYLMQYFERERMEHHPALAGTEYEVLLGRLGNEVLLKQGRNWLEFEKSDPSEENYIAATGFAVPQMFLDYWSSYGLDLGDPGISFRESLALFGYPISQAEMETNADGDTVLTQWFERARFEYHPDNAAEFQVLLGRLGAEVLAGDVEPPPPTEPDYTLTVVAEGLGFPLHASTGGDGAIYVADGGVPSEDDECVILGEDPETGEVFEACFGLNGSVVRVDDSGAETVVTGLPAINDVHVTAEGDMYAVVGLGGTPETRDLFENEDAQAMGTLIQIHGDGEWTIIADLAQFEADENPDPTMVDSNPYALTMDGDDFLVVDAGGNDLLHVTMDGEITVLAVFDTREVQNPFAPEGVMQAMESVPTDVEVGPDGNYYVSELTGFPFEVGAARVFQVTPEGDVTVFAEGFSAIGAIDFDSEGNLYVLEIATNGLLAAEMDPTNPDATLSRLVVVGPDGTQEDLITEGIMAATGVALDADDTIYIVNASLSPMPHVVRVDWNIEE